MQTEQKIWKRGDIHPVTGRYFWVYTNRSGVGHERWIPVEKVEAYRNTSRKGTQKYRKSEKGKETKKRRQSTIEAKKKAVEAVLKSRQKPEVKARYEEYCKNYRRKNAEALREKARARFSAWLSDPKKREQVKARIKAYITSELGRKKRSEAVRRRRARVVGVTVVDSPQFAVIEEHRLRLQKCLQIPFHVDHIVPLAKGGAHHPDNLQVIPASLNQKKNARTDYKLPDCWLSGERALKQNHTTPCSASH